MDKHKLEEYREYVNNQLPDFLPKAPMNIGGKPSYICPVCGNGSGSTGSGINFYLNKHRKPRWHCFKCPENGDRDVIQLWKDGTGKSEIELFKYYGLLVDDTTPAIKRSTPASSSAPVSKKANTEPSEPIVKDYTEDYKKWHDAVNQTTYFKERGITDTSIEKFNLGYDAKWNSIVFPVTTSAYNTRVINPTKAKNYKTGTYAGVYNSEAIDESDINPIEKRPLFIVEGEIDCITIDQMGYDAVATRGKETDTIINLVKSKKINQPIIIALDNDETGIGIGKKLYNTLNTECNYYGNCVFMNEYLYKPYKDANEAYLKSPDDFAERLKICVNVISDMQKQTKKIELQKYYNNSVAAHFEAFEGEIQGSVDTPAIPTGYGLLDQRLEGGLYEGLYIIGAASSVGKTTFSLQMADQIAEAGTDILIFALEMSRYELMAKSISRNTYKYVRDNNISSALAKTSRGITRGSLYKNYNADEKRIIEAAKEKYKQYAERIFIIEGIGDIGIKEITEAVNTHISITGNKPVVLIDYLQILAPYNERYSDKQNTDKTVLELKRLSRTHKIPVICISSINRKSYNENMDMSAFKESGSIEYSADVLIGLRHINNEDGTNTDPREPREIEALVLKNRQGAKDTKTTFNYYPLFNYFE